MSPASLEALTDPNLPGSGQGVRRMAIFVLQEFTVEAIPLDKADVTNKSPSKRYG